MFNLEQIDNHCYKVVSDTSYDNLLIKEDNIASIMGSPVCSNIFIDSYGSIRKQLNKDSKLSFLKLSGEGNEEIYISSSKSLIALEVSDDSPISISIDSVVAILGTFKYMKESVEYLSDRYCTFINSGDLKLIVSINESPLILQGRLKINSSNLVGWKGDTPREINDSLIKGCDLEFSDNTKVILQTGKDDYVLKDKEIVESVEVVSNTTTTTKKTIKNTNLESVLDF